MNYTRMKSFLERTTNIAVLFVALIFIGVLAASFWGAQTETKQLTAGLQKYQTLPQVPGIDYKNTSQTLLIAMNSDCDFCQESLPFYNRLAVLKQEKGNNIKLLAIFPNTRIEVEGYVKQHQLNLDTVAEVSLDTISVPGPPAIVLVDGAGRVLNFWIGKLAKDSEQEVIKALGL